MTLRTAGLLVTLVLSILLAPLAAEAQQPAKVYRIGMLTGTRPTPPSAQPTQVGFWQGMRERGWVEGQNFVVVAPSEKYQVDRPDRFPALAAELVRLKVDIIVAATAPGIRAAQQATKTIPIVMAVVVDPVATGFVASLARPGGNVTGVTSAFSELSGKHLELLKEFAAGIARVAVLQNPTNPASRLHLQETKAAARALGVELQVLDVRGPDDFDSAFSAVRKERSGGLIILGDAIFNIHVKRLADLAAKSKVPAIYPRREFADAGGLMSYGASLPDQFRHAATYVDKILKGVKPADLPVEQPTRFELVINLKTARALGLTIPQSILARADQVIK